ncbi:MAG: hypothetical protein AB8G05_03645 [Oligoflexales bacterium]
MLNYFLFFLLAIFPLFVYGTEPENKPPILEIADDLTFRIFGFLKEEELVDYSESNKSSHRLFGAYVSSPVDSPNGQNLRKSSYFHIVVENDLCLFLNEYLKKKQHTPISTIENIVELSKKFPNILLEILLKADPKNHKQSYAQLEYFFNTTFAMDRIISHLPAFKSNHENLASVLIELLTWTHIWWSKARETVIKEIKEQLDDHLAQDISLQTFDQLNLIIEQRAGGHIRDQLWDQVWDKVGNELDIFIWDTAFQIEQLNSNPSVITLKHFPFLLAHKQGTLDEMVRSAMDYSFMMYQMENIVLRNSEFFLEQHRNLANTILFNLPSKQIKDALRSIMPPQNQTIF